MVSKKNERLDREKTRLVSEVRALQDEMAATLNNFSDATQPELVEYYTYYYKASEIRHSYLLRQLKKIYYCTH